MTLRVAPQSTGKRYNTDPFCGNASKKSTTTLPQGGESVDEPNLKLTIMESLTTCTTPQNTEKRYNTDPYCGNASRKSRATLPQGGKCVGKPNYMGTDITCTKHN